MKIAISSDSTSDLSPELIKENDIKIIPFTVILGEDVFKDNELTPSKIFEYVEKTGNLPSTSAINVETYSEHFQNIFDEGFDYILHIGFSSELSSSFNNACEAALRFNKKVILVDSKSLSTGTALLVLYAKDLANRGFDPRIIADRLRRRVPYIQASFVIPSLDYLHKGGRCSSLTKFGANLLKIKPQILVENGKMVTGKYYRGKDKGVIRKYCEDTLEKFNNPDKSVAFITSPDFGLNDELFDICEEYLKAYGFNKIIKTAASSTITSHCGPGTIGILYMNDGDRKADYPNGK